MEEKFYPEEEQKEDTSYQHRSHYCGLFFSYKLLVSKTPAKTGLIVELRRSP